MKFQPPLEAPRLPMLWHCRHQPRVPPAATGPPRPSGGPAPLPLAAELPRTSPCRGPQRHPCPLLPGLPPAAAAAPLVPCHPAAQDTPYPQHPGTVRASRPAQPRVSVEMASPEPAQPEREGFHGDAVSSTAQPAREIAAAMPEPGPRCLQWGRSPWGQAAATRAAPGVAVCFPRSSAAGGGMRAGGHQTCHCCSGHLGRTVASLTGCPGGDTYPAVPTPRVCPCPSRQLSN